MRKKAEKLSGTRSRPREETERARDAKGSAPSPPFVGLRRGKQERLRCVAAALEARRHAHTPYSKFQVGAALLTRGGRIICGANVESASYGLTCCAERVALFNAVSQGEREFTAIAVVAQADGGPMPCGACRQLLAELAPRARVWIADSRDPRRIKEFRVATLLPKAFVDF